MSRPKLHLDLESRSAVTDLKKAGVYLYSRHPTTDVWCACWAIDDAPVRVWRPGEALPPELREGLREGIVAAHNAAFEALMLQHLLTPRYGWPGVDLARWDDTAARAAVMALPRDLAGAAKALGLPVEKDAEGRQLMLRMAKPRKQRRLEEGISTEDAWDLATDHPERFTYHARSLYEWWATEEKLARLIAYCERDVEVERALDKVLIPLTPREHKIWMADFQANQRGIRIDRQLVRSAAETVEMSLKEYSQQLATLTHGHVTKTSQAAKQIDWLKRQGIDTDSVGKPAVAELLEDESLQGAPRELLEIRQEAAKSSTAKLTAFQLRSDDADDRMRELLLYHGASTGRWAGRGPQLQNLPRPTLKKPQVERALRILKSGWSVEERVAGIEFVLGPVPTVVASCLRGCLIASEGKTLRVADYANIEGRKLAWLAGEQWKIAAFQAYDEGHGTDMYKVTAGGLFGTDPDNVDDDGRQIGKVCELSMGYEGGVGAFDSMAANYKLKIGEHYDTVTRAADPEHVDRAEWAWGAYGHKNPLGLGERTWIAAETVKLAWRAKHPAVVQFWADTQEAAIEAVKFHKPTQAGPLGFSLRSHGGVQFLRMRLPSGRYLYYCQPRVRRVKVFGRERDQLTYWGVDRYTRKWSQQSTYGGDLVQSATQASARDLLAVAILRSEKHGYPVLLTVHDEIIAETDADYGCQEEFEAVMAEVPPWAQGCPVAVEGYSATRYRKG